MKKIILFILVLIAILGISDTIFDFKQIYTDYKEKQQQEEINEFAEMMKQHYRNKNAAFEKENADIVSVDVVFIGDSLTEGYSLPDFYTGFSVLNRGIGGDTTFGVEDRLNTSAFEVNPRVVVMMIGTNNVDSMLDNYESILIKMKENLPDTKVVVMSVPPAGQGCADRNPTIALNNVSLKLLAEKHGCIYVDIFSLLYDVNTGELRAEYTTDGIHFTKEGYDVITNELNPILLDLLNN